MKLLLRIKFDPLFMLIDIAFNFSHCRSFEETIRNAKKSNVYPILVGLDIETSKEAINLANKYCLCCFCGIHPLSIHPLPVNLLSLPQNKSLTDIEWSNHHIIGIGECGIDLFRANNFEDQKEVFLQHLSLQNSFPYFFHVRGAYEEFIQLISGYKVQGVVHSFDGTLEEAEKIISKGLLIGINGCSIKKSIEVVKNIPIESILIETDSPYCLIRKSYAGFQYLNEETKNLIKKYKENTPEYLWVIAEAIANIKRISIEEVEKITSENTISLFPGILQFINKFFI